jgi:hypothetical protein
MLQDQKTNLDRWLIFAACAVLLAASVWHMTVLPSWPGWRYKPIPFVGLAIQLIPVFGFVASLIAVGLGIYGRGRSASLLVKWALVPTLCVLALDGCRGTIGLVD